MGRTFLLVFASIAVSLASAPHSIAQSGDVFAANFLFGDIGGGKYFQSAIQLVNLAEVPTEVTIDCFANDGTPTPPFSLGPNSVVLPSNQGIELYTRGPGEFRECWCRIRKNPDNKLEVSTRILLYEPSTAVPFPLTSALTASVRIPGSAQASQWKVPVSLVHVYWRVLSASAISVVNPSDSAAELELALDWHSEVGTTQYGPVHLTIPSRSRIARDLIEIFPDVVPKPGIPILPSVTGGQGILTVTAKVPVVVSGLDVSAPIIVYTSMLTIPVP